MGLAKSDGLLNERNSLDYIDKLIELTYCFKEKKQSARSIESGSWERNAIDTSVQIKSIFVSHS